MNAWANTDIGFSRTQNQDYYNLEINHDTGFALCVVCDGMGGAKAGNIASEIAANSFFEELHMLIKPGMTLKAKRTYIRQATTIANKKVYDKSLSSPDYYGMGTTLVGGIVTPSQAVIANVGDSRGYLIDRTGIQRITRDHSVVEDMLYRGDLSAEEAKNHPSKNLITRALGTDETVLCDIFSVEIRQGDYLVLCSDGLTNVIDDQEILYEVLHGGNPANCCQRLIRIANSRGGPDNITVILLSF